MEIEGGQRHRIKNAVKNHMDKFLTLSFLFVGITLGLGVNAFIMYRKISKRNHSIVLLGKPKKIYLFGLVAMVLTLVLYIGFKVPDNLVSFSAMMGIVSAYTFFSFMYRDLVPFYSDEGIFINDNEVSYDNLISYKITHENEKNQRINVTYRTVSKGKMKKEKVEWGVVRPDVETTKDFLKRLRLKKIRRLTD